MESDTDMHSPSLTDIVEQFMPESYDYKIVSGSSRCLSHFEIEIRANVTTEAGVKQFLSELNVTSGCTFNTQSGRPDKRQDKNSSRSKLRGFRKCFMNVKHSEDKENQQPGKNTDCPASINFRLENPIGKYKLEKEDRMNFPLWLNIEFSHNHSLNRAEYFRFMSVSEDTRNTYTEMFNLGLTPSAAHAERRRELKVKYPDTWPEVSADRSRLPSLFWVYEWHRKCMDITIGSRDGIDAYEKAENVIKKFDLECKKDFPLPDGEYYAKIVQTDSGETVIAIVDPFMHRVHTTVPQSGEIIMIDATSNLDRTDSKLFHLVCPTAVGALPLAEIITTREDGPTVLFALELLKSILPAGAFYGRGRNAGPKVFMTDDSDAERNSLQSAWPQSVLLLCTFHVLQAQWSWIWEAKHSIDHEDKTVLIQLFRNVLYAETADQLSARLEDMYSNPVMLKYPQYQKHLLRDTFPKMTAWSIFHRISQKLPTSGQNTNNMVESSFRYTKDTQFNRLKAFNLTDMLTLVLDNSEHYSNKCIDAGNNVIKSWLKNCHSKYVIKVPNIDPGQIVDLGGDAYLVPSETQQDVSYVVDMVLRCCTCPQGRLCGPCKHKVAVSKAKNVPSFDVLPTHSPQMRQTYMYIGTGRTMPLDWFLPVQAESDSSINPEVPNIQQAEVQPALNQEEEMEINVGTETTAEAENQAEIVKMKLLKVLDKLGSKFMARIDHDPAGYAKAVDKLDKTVDRLPAKGDSALQKSLCEFGKTVTQVYSI